MRDLNLKQPIKIDRTANDDGYVITDANGTEFFFYEKEKGSTEMVYDGFCSGIKPSISEEATIEQIINGVDCPLPIDIIPNLMGINLVSVDKVQWGKQKDGQLTHLTIVFTPNHKS